MQNIAVITLIVHFSVRDQRPCKPLLWPGAKLSSQSQGDVPAPRQECVKSP